MLQSHEAEGIITLGGTRLHAAQSVWEGSSTVFQIP